VRTCANLREGAARGDAQQFVEVTHSDYELSFVTTKLVKGKDKRAGNIEQKGWELRAGPEQRTESGEKIVESRELRAERREQIAGSGKPD
jgi:hypothetical protein